MISLQNSLCGLGPGLIVPSDSGLGCASLWVLGLGFALGCAAFCRRLIRRSRKSAADCLRMEAQRTALLLNSRELLYGVDLKTHQFMYMSSSCFDLTGYPAEELKGMGLNGLLQRVHPDDKEEVLKLIETVRTPRKESEWSGGLTCRFLHRDGQYRSFSDRVHVCYGPEGEAVSLKGFVLEVTQIVCLEEEKHDLELKFLDSQKMAGLGLLASGIAHDFNNLMTVVLGNTELALLDRADSDGGMLEEIKRATLRAAELATQMLVYTGKTDVAAANINLSSVVKEMGSLLEVSISKKVQISYDLADTLPPIFGDVSQLRQVAMNLITNASEAIGDRPGVIAIRIGEVNLKPGSLTHSFPLGHIPSGPHIELEVSDSGSGMTEETLHKIFDPLFTTKITGRGLGLASVLNAVQRHNGAVAVESSVGTGTVFHVYFPVKVLPIDEAGCAEPASEEEWHGEGTVLIADDEESIRQVATILMQRLGFRVITAVDGLETVDLYKENAKDISILLMDLNMPKLNGLEAAQRIRRITPDVPLLFMSGYPREQVMDQFGHQSHAGFVKKPFQSLDLMSAVKQVLDS